MPKKISLTAKNIVYTYCCRCSACDHMLSLPGIIPSKETLRDWKFCPYCGLKLKVKEVKNAE